MGYQSRDFLDLNNPMAKLGERFGNYYLIQKPLETIYFPIPQWRGARYDEYGASVCKGSREAW